VESNPYESPSVAADRDPTHSLPPKGGWKWVAISAVAVIAASPISFANLPVLIALGWTASRAWPSQTRAICRYLPIATALLLGALAISGIWRLSGNVGDFHRWTGHLLVLLMWLCVPFSLGCLWHQKARSRPILTLCQSVSLLLCMLMTLSASMTGYLDKDPVPYPEIAEETHNRFVALHFFIQPIFITSMLVVWNIAFWSPRNVVPAPTSNI
jgi:hypothetical protein